MPAEVERLNHPVDARDKRLLRLVACVGVLAIAIGIALYAGRSHREAAPGCIEANAAGVMGGGTVKGCGDDALRLCRQYAPTFPDVAEQCAALPTKP